MVERIGQATGYDSISDFSYAAGIATLLDSMERDDLLPKTMLFCLNPAMNDVLGAMIGNFQAGPVRGKIQYGPAWWFNDHKAGNLEQFVSLANLGSLGTSVGMVTDSLSVLLRTRGMITTAVCCAGSSGNGFKQGRVS